MLRPESRLVLRRLQSVAGLCPRSHPHASLAASAGAPCVLAQLAFRAPEHQGTSAAEHWRKALATAARALRHRDLSTRTLGERLSRAGVTSATRAETIETLSRAGFLNDERFAVARARSLVERNMGDAAIRHDLEQHGVDAETAERAFAEHPPESERVGRVLARRGCSPATARYLARRGFCADVVADALGEVAPDP